MRIAVSGASASNILLWVSSLDSFRGIEGQSEASEGLQLRELREVGVRVLQIRVVAFRAGRNEQVRCGN